MRGDNYQALTPPEAGVWVLDLGLMSRWDASESQSHQQVSEHTYRVLRERTTADAIGEPLAVQVADVGYGLGEMFGLEEPVERVAVFMGVRFGLEAAGLENERSWAIPRKVHPSIAWALFHLLADTPAAALHNWVLYASQVGYWMGRTGDSPQTVLDRIRASL